MSLSFDVAPLETVVRVGLQQTSVEVGDEAVILDLKGNQYFSLEGVGRRVWQLLQEPRSLADLRQTLMDEYDVDVERCERELRALLTDLAGEGLVCAEPAERR